eukprot:CAMPEP_0172584816 /NCGR_PEP_ID=MMETSP1068-20121228/4394_1 /TAXON_ID=35684 /ORGANISM="Pseudopedinella elastica, Strain CCMP716" /LENGTH=802 /DNA_ID=CAMNT_0013379117 /DNA_START=74 /DNA_END=2482 /DNA_ORIENTATION=-
MEQSLMKPSSGDEAAKKRKADANTYKAMVNETYHSPHFALLAARDLDAGDSVTDSLAYKLENSIAADPNVRFYILFALAAGAMVVLSYLWSLFSDPEWDTHDFTSAVFMTFQVLITGGYEDSFQDPATRLLFFCMIATGVTIVSILIGLITDTVNSYMEELSSGTSKVIEDGHTLVLGWNEATTRVVCQIAFLRRVFLMQNETWERKVMWWRRVLPSSPVAARPVVIMNQTMEKTDMEAIIGSAFSARNINPKRTKIGRDVIFRKGDPSNNHDLVRVRAHKATSVLVMMNSVDFEEQSEGMAIENSATVRTVLALRNIIYSNGDPETAHLSFKPDLRVVVQLSATCPFMHGASFLAPLGHECLYPQDITKYVNSMLFTCAMKPSLSRVIMSLVDFQGSAIRTRPPTQLFAGKDNQLGWLIGKTMREAQLGVCWGNGILIGVDDEVMNMPHENSLGELGIMGDPDRVINASDHMIFISPTSTPKVDPSLDTSVLAKEAELYLPHASTGSKTLDPAKMVPTHLLLLGWREVWTKDPNRLCQRVQGLYSDMPVLEGSTVTIVNPMPEEEMAEVLGSPGSGFAKQGLGWVTSGGGGSGDGKVLLLHVSGDSTAHATLEKLIAEPDTVFNTAIVLGTSYGQDSGPISSECSDSRVLGTLLVLRVLCDKLGMSMHCVAENLQDQTSQLFLGPQPRKGEHADFINTQAIVARSLAMNLAYPQIWHALEDLLRDGLGTAEIEFIDCGHLGLEKKEARFGALQHVLSPTYQGRALAIGFSDAVGGFQLCPPPGTKIKFDEGYRVICIIRRV